MSVACERRFAIAKADRRTIRDGKPTGKKGKKKKNDRLIRAMLRAAHLPEWSHVRPRLAVASWQPCSST